MADSPDVCAFHHSVFSLSGVSFRRVSDGAAVMAIPFGDTTACVTLGSLRREFQIAPDSEDGRMLSLVDDSLDFVGSLRVGDRLPAEVLSGGASWTAGQQYRDAADARLQRHLVAWLAGMGRTAGLAAGGDEVRAQVQAALGAAASELDLPGPKEVLQLMERIAGELSYIEALRDTLLRRVQVMVRKVHRLALRRTRDAVHQETMMQVQRLSEIAHRHLSGRFIELDARAGEVLSMLRSVDGEGAFIRSSRDWLYRTSRAWSPLLDEWSRSQLVLDEFAWGLLARTYQFLAPRYMPVTEWQSAAKRLQPRLQAMPW